MYDLMKVIIIYLTTFVEISHNFGEPVWPAFFYSTVSSVWNKTRGFNRTVYERIEDYFNKLDIIDEIMKFPIENLGIRINTNLDGRRSVAKEFGKINLRQDKSPLIDWEKGSQYYEATRNLLGHLMEQAIYNARYRLRFMQALREKYVDTFNYKIAFTISKSLYYYRIFHLELSLLFQAIGYEPIDPLYNIELFLYLYENLMYTRVDFYLLFDVVMSMHEKYQEKEKERMRKDRDKNRMSTKRPRKDLRSRHSFKR